MSLNEYGRGIVNGHKIGHDENLMDADLRGADLRGADLRRANLNYADLRGADLSNACLLGATMVGVMLEDADFDYIEVDAHNLHHFETENNSQITKLRAELEYRLHRIKSIYVGGRPSW